MYRLKKIHFYSNLWIANTILGLESYSAGYIVLKFNRTSKSFALTDGTLKKSGTVVIEDGLKNATNRQRQSRIEITW